MPQSFPSTSVGPKLGDPPFLYTPKQLKWVLVLFLTTYVIGIFQHLNSGRKCAFFLSLVPSVLIPSSLFRVFSCYAHLLKTQSPGPEVWPIMKVLMAAGKIHHGNFVFWKLGIENTFGKIEVYDRVNHDIQRAIGRLGGKLFVQVVCFVSWKGTGWEMNRLQNVLSFWCMHQKLRSQLKRLVSKPDQNTQQSGGATCQARAPRTGSGTGRVELWRWLERL